MAPASVAQAGKHRACQLAPQALLRPVWGGGGPLQLCRGPQGLPTTPLAWSIPSQNVTAPGLVPASLPLDMAPTTLPECGHPTASAQALAAYSSSKIWREGLCWGSGAKPESFSWGSRVLSKATPTYARAEIGHSYAEWTLTLCLQPLLLPKRLRQWLSRNRRAAGQEAVGLGTPTAVRGDLPPEQEGRGLLGG